MGIGGDVVEGDIEGLAGRVVAELQPPNRGLSQVLRRAWGISQVRYRAPVVPDLHPTCLAITRFVCRWTWTSCQSPVVTDAGTGAGKCRPRYVVAIGQLAAARDVEPQDRNVRAVAEPSQVGAAGRRGAQELEPHPVIEICLGASSVSDA